MNVLFTLIFFTLPLKSNLVTVLILEFNEPTSMSSVNPCKAFWNFFIPYSFYK